MKNHRNSFMYWEPANEESKQKSLPASQILYSNFKYYIVHYLFFFSDHECFTEKFRLKLKKVGKTIRTFRYDLNQIPYDYTVEVTNTFKGLDLIDRVREELWQRFVILDRRW